VLAVTLFLNAPDSWQFGFQEPASPAMSTMVDLHQDIMNYLIQILSVVSWILYAIITHFNVKNNETLRAEFTHHTGLETVWTLVPTAILLALIVPSSALLLELVEVNNWQLVVKVIGHQWYWRYELAGEQEGGEEANETIESRLLPEDELPEGAPRLLEVDNRLYLPADAAVRFLITGADVLHSWAVPALGIKVDGCPGRLNHASISNAFPGVYYGQCSELCGVGHAVMPIVVQLTE
jgi:cytochrome c oxidase subunit 2